MTELDLVVDALLAPVVDALGLTRADRGAHIEPGGVSLRHVGVGGRVIDPEADAADLKAFFRDLKRQHPQRNARCSHIGHERFDGRRHHDDGGFAEQEPLEPHDGAPGSVKQGGAPEARVIGGAIFARQARKVAFALLTQLAGAGRHVPTRFPRVCHLVVVGVRAGDAHSGCPVWVANARTIPALPSWVNQSSGCLADLRRL